MSSDITRYDRTAVPAVLKRAGANAMFTAEEFFKALLSNDHTKRACGRVVRNFLAWCEIHNYELREITPGIAGEYMAQLPGSAPTNIRLWRLCDILSMPW